MSREKFDLLLESINRRFIILGCGFERYMRRKIISICTSICNICNKCVEYYIFNVRCRHNSSLYCQSCGGLPSTQFMLIISKEMHEQCFNPSKAILHRNSIKCNPGFSPYGHLRMFSIEGIVSLQKNFLAQNVLYNILWTDDLKFFTRSIIFYIQVVHPYM